MKYIIATFILFVPLISMSQSYDDDNDSTKIENLFKDLKETWNLGIIDENSSTNIWLFNRFKSLFDSTATIDDEFNAKFVFNPYNGKAYYQVEKNKKYNEYAHNVILEVNKIDDSVGQYERIKSNDDQYLFKIFRNVKASKKRQYVLMQPAKLFFDQLLAVRQPKLCGPTDSAKVYKDPIYNDMDKVYDFESNTTLLITLIKVEGEFKIKKISIDDLSIHGVICKNDIDNDGVLDLDEDKEINVKEPGDFTAKGLKDFDFDGISDINDSLEDACKCAYGVTWNEGCPWYYFRNKVAFNGFIGMRLNSGKLTLPWIERSGYESADINQSEVGSIKNPNALFSVVYGADISYYFGKANNFGVSLGLSYNYYNANYGLENKTVYTYKSNDQYNNYRRRITTYDGAKEKVNFQILNMPLLCKVRGRLNKRNTDQEKRAYFEISAGPSLAAFNMRSEYNAKIDFEGLYQVDTFLKDRLTYYDYYDENSTWNIVMSGSEVNQQSSNPGVKPFFDQLNSKGYDFAYNKIFDDTDYGIKRVTLGFNANAEIAYQLNDVILKVGVSFLYARSKQAVIGFKPIKSSTESYNSFLRSNAQFTYMNYGINIGAAYGL